MPYIQILIWHFYNNLDIYECVENCQKTKTKIHFSVWLLSNPGDTVLFLLKYKEVRISEWNIRSFFIGNLHRWMYYRSTVHPISSYKKKLIIHYTLLTAIKRAKQSEIMVNVYKWNIALLLIKVPSWRWVYHDTGE